MISGCVLSSLSQLIYTLAVWFNLYIWVMQMWHYGLIYFYAKALYRSEVNVILKEFFFKKDASDRSDVVILIWISIVYTDIFSILNVIYTDNLHCDLEDGLMYNIKKQHYSRCKGDRHTYISIGGENMPFAMSYLWIYLLLSSIYNNISHSYTHFCRDSKFKIWSLVLFLH